MPGAARRARPVACPQDSLASRCPHAEQVLDEGYQRSITTAAGRNAALVFQLAAELTPAAVGDDAGQVPVADHVAYGQVLDHDHVVAADQAGAGAVHKVAPGVADLAVRAGDLRLGLGQVRRPFRHRASRRWYRASLRALRSRSRGSAIFSPPLVTAKSRTPRSTPTARPVAGSGSGAWVSTAKVTYQRPSGSRAPQPSSGQASPSPPATTIGTAMGRWSSPATARRPAWKTRCGCSARFGASAGLKPRVAGALGEECGERLVLVAQRLLQRHRGDLVQKRQARVFLHGGQRPVGLRVRGGLSLGGIPLLACVQGVVPHLPHAAEGAVQHRCCAGSG